jgi:hypothetical protein
MTLDAHSMVSALPAWFGLVLSLGGLVYSAGVIGARVDEHSRTLAIMQADSKAASNDRGGIMERLGRIDTKLDFLMGDHRSGRWTAQRE